MLCFAFVNAVTADKSIGCKFLFIVVTRFCVKQRISSNPWDLCIVLGHVLTPLKLAQLLL